MVEQVKRKYTHTSIDALKNKPMSKFGVFIRDSVGYSFFFKGKAIDKWEAFAHCKDFRKIYLQRVEGLRTVSYNHLTPDN